MWVPLAAASRPRLILLGSKSTKSTKSDVGVFATPAPTAEVSLDDLDDLLRQAALNKKLRQPILRGLKALVEADPTCHTGDAAAVTKACAGKCCTEDLSCVWNGEATICEGACSGKLACALILTNSVIMHDSCSGASACAGMGGDDGATDFVPVFIAPKSCDDVDKPHSVDTDLQFVCGYMGASAETLIVASESCTGKRSCESAVKATTKSVFFGPTSCDGDQSCSYIAKVADDVDVFVGSAACTHVVRRCITIYGLYYICRSTRRTVAAGVF